MTDEVLCEMSRALSSEEADKLAEIASGYPTLHGYFYGLGPLKHGRYGSIEIRLIENPALLRYG